MPETQIQKIWKDPVWSKVIASIVLLLLTFLYNFIYSLFQDITFINSVKKLWTSSIQLWIVVSGIIICQIMIWIIKYYLRKNKISFIYDDQSLALDIQLFNRIRYELLPQDGTIYWLRHFNFAGFSFNIHYLAPLIDIGIEAKKSDFEFLNPELESKKQDLIREIENFTSLTAVNTFPTHNGLQTVPPEWEIEQSERFWKVVNEIHISKKKICDKYDELFRECRNILKV